MLKPRIRLAALIVTAVAAAATASFLVPAHNALAGQSGSVNPDGYTGHCMPQEEGDYTPALMDRLSAEDGYKVIPLPQGSIAIIPQDCTLPPAPFGVPQSAWNAQWNCEYVPVSEDSQYSAPEAQAMIHNGYTPAPAAGEELNPRGC